ncbi:MAG: TraB/GumN family protein [Kordiimonas sp.]
MKNIILLSVFCVFLTSCLERRGPAVWVIKDTDTEMYITGTVHALPKKTSWYYSDIEALIASSRGVFFEVDETAPENQKIDRYLRKYGLLNGTRNLKELLPEHLYKDLRSGLVRFSQLSSTIDQMKPWHAAFIYEARKYFIQHKYKMDHTLDTLALETVRKYSVPIISLETIEAQLQVLDGLSDEQEVIYVKSVLDGDVNSLSNTEQSIEAWRLGNVDEQKRLLETYTRSYPSLAENLLYQRNKNWADRLALQMVERDGAYVVIVGVAHLVGDNSLLDLLRNQGFDVQRVY